jgi:hypothetical protein
MSVNVIFRPDFKEELMNGLRPGTEMDQSDITRYCFEVIVFLSIDLYSIRSAPSSVFSPSWSFNKDLS